jgi:TolA-binding protein
MILACCFCMPLFAYSQKTVEFQDLNKERNEANFSFNEKNYSLAYNQYSVIIKRYMSIADHHFNFNNQTNDLEDLYFKRALCSYYLMNKDVDVLMKEFITLFPNSNKVAAAYFYTANYYVLQGDFLLALITYKNMDTSSLNEDEKEEYNYKLGYCYFLNNDKTKAKVCFEKVKDLGGKYSSAAKYYYAHILYTEGSYNLALKEFEDLKKDRKFGKIVPYYICQIYYFQENYPKIIEMAPTLSENAINSKRSTELNRMLGDSYYKMGQYEEAIPYIKKSIESSSAVNKEDNYLMGYCLMKTQKYDEAIPYLKAAAMDKDTMSQNALYNLGYCCLSTQDTTAAQTYFKAASEINGDKNIQEEAMFSYYKLCINAPSPYNEAIRGFQSYIKKYPKSKRKDEAKSYLVQLYERTKNYKDAVSLIEQMDVRNEEINEVYQKVCLNNGIELFNNKKYSQAISLFNKSLKQPLDNNLTSSAYYLKSESYYRMGNYAKAVNELNSFYSVPSNEKSEYHNLADYSMGYCLFKQKKYTLAKKYFNNSLKDVIKMDKDLKIDATTRLGDCYYMSKEYSDAIEKYSSVIANKSTNADYCSYQKAMALGAIGKHKEKASLLSSAIKSYPNSTYISSMNFELANTYLALDENEKALETYQDILTKYPNSNSTKETLGKVGMLQYKNGQEDKALKTLDKLVKTYPNTPEAKAALITIKNIYMDKGNTDDFFAYMKTIPSGKISKNEQDSIVYMAAENKYMDEKYSVAKDGFEKYLNNFPQGLFYNKANYYLASCLVALGDTASSIKYYEVVASQPKTSFTEKAILMAASGYKNTDYKKANDLYQKLNAITESSTNKIEAQRGLMTTYYGMKDYNNAIVSAISFKQQEKTTKDMEDEANYIIAKSYYAMDSNDKSKEYFSYLTSSTNGSYKAEASYSLANIAFKNAEYDKSEKIIKQMSKNPTDEYFLAKAFILWSDIFVKKGNTFQAKQTLQSIIDNYDGKDIVEEAQSKLNALNDLENKKKQENNKQLENQENSVDEIIIEDKK